MSREKNGNAESLRGALPWRVYFAAVSLVGFATVLAETARYGIGISPDSVGYIEQARRLAEPGAIERVLGSPEFVTQPPLYPLALACLERITGADPAVAVRTFNATLLAAVIYAACTSLLFAAGRRVHAAVAVTAPIYILSSRSLHEVFGMAWSEPLFILLSVLFLVSLARYLRAGEAAALFFAAVLATAAVFVRYSGVTLIATGALVIPFAARLSARAKIRHGVLFAASTAGLFGLWALRNHHLTGTPLGARDPALYPFAENAARMFAIAQAHLLPGGEEIGLWGKAAAGLAIAGLALSSLLPRRASIVADLVAARAVVIPCAVFAFVFCGFTLATSSLVAYDPIDFRLLSPAFLPLWAIAAVILNAAIRAEGNEGTPRSARYRAIALIVLLSIQPARQYIRDFAEWREQGRGLSRSVWAESPLLASLRNGEILGGVRPVFSDMRSVIVWYVGGSVKNAPARTGCTGRTGAAARQCFLDTVDPEFFDSYLVDFSAQRYAYYYTLEELREFVDLETVTKTEDGRVVRVSRRATGVGAESDRGFRETRPVPGKRY